MLRRRWFVTMLVLPALLLVGNTSSGVIPGPDSVAADSFKCPAGYVVAGAEERIRSGGPLQMAQEGLESPVVCVNAKHPEPMGEIYGKIGQEFAIQAAPTGTIPKGVYIKAIHARKRVQRQGQTAENSHRWKAYGNGPLRSADPEYGGVNGTGLVNLAGRITDYAYSGPKDKKNPNTLFASVAYGGVWKSTNQGKSWKSISKRLPTEVIGSVGYTPYKGTIVAVTGDGSFGRYSREGAGVWFSRNKGKTWRRSKGVPSDAFGFNVAFDAAHPRRVYVATGTGLFRSRNGAKSFKNVKLPTGDCAGKSNRAKGCLLANMVTDVVVQQPKGSTDVKGGAVLAAVGWRGGDRENPDGTVQSPNNGLYSSPNGRVGTFEKLGATGFTPQDRIGRIELGPAVGPDQDHNYVYAVVQDAVLLRGGTPGIDAPGGEEAPNLPTVLNGIYVSADFGASWTVMADASELQGPTTGSALAGTAQSGGYGPGIQSWYNEWIQPDPTKQVGGVPTRLLFGLEEVWMNEQTDTPQTGKSSFKVIGRYFSGSTCLFLTGTFPVCPTNREDAAVETTTTHPDQQASIFIPNPDPEQENSVRLIVGNDGGVYTQNAAEGDDFDNAHWGKGSQRGMRTLLPYDATIANDGTVWMGLQDNGTAKIQDVRKKGKVVSRKRQMMTLGGDGFFTAVEPNNSDIAYGEYTYGAMSATIDGGRTWTGMNPPGLDGTTAQFSNQFVMDPLNPRHLMTAGNQVVETGSGTGTGEEDWAIPYKLGTQKHPGDQNAVAADDDPVNQMSSIDMYGNKAYVGYCGVCNMLDSTNPFKNGIAANVGGKKPPVSFKSSGWHIAKAIGLPNRYITSLKIDKKKSKRVYAALGGYNARWVPPNALDKNPNVGTGHLFVSNDAGNHFKNISANLPNIPVNWVTMRGQQILVATDVGIYISKKNFKCSNPASPKCHRFQYLGKGLPKTQIATVRVAPCDKNLLVVATFGRGVWTYRFGPPGPGCPKEETLPPPPFLKKPVAGPFTFETDAEGWTVRGATTPEAWHLAPPGDASAQGFAVGPPYQNESSYSLISPKMKLADRSKVKLTWAERTNTEDGFDYLSVQWSSDSYSWNQVTAHSGINAEYPLFTPREASFIAPKGALYIRFRMTSDQLVNGEGVNVDNVLVQR